MKALNFLLLRAPLQSLTLASAEPPFELSPMFIDGIRLAAPVFYNELQKTDVTNKKEEKKIQDSLYKYWLRSCTRCTPYGFFAGSTIVKVDDTISSSIILDDHNASILRSRLDMGYLTLLTAEIEKLPNVQSQLRFIINNSLYETPFDYRFVEYSLNENIRNYKLSAIEKTEYLDFVFKCAKDYITLNELTTKLAEFSGVDKDEAHVFIMEIINNQLLISELELVLSGTDPLRNLINRLKEISRTTDIVDKLNRIETYLINLKNYSYEEVERNVLGVFDLTGTHKDVIQVDLSLSALENRISKSLVDEIVSQITDLQSLARLAFNSNLNDFKRKFAEKYESAEVPLAIVLDNDLGIGYGLDEKSENDEWIQAIPDVVPFSSEGSFQQDYITKFTFNKYQDFVMTQKSEIEITEEELKNMPKNNYKFSSSAYLFGSLFSNDLNKEDFLFNLKGFGNSSIATLSGRFTLGDEELTKFTKCALENEEAEYPNAIFAEIIHIPQARSGNILLRSSLRKYEIPYLGKSGIAKEYQIPVTDLMVSVKNNIVILRSIKNNKRVFPRLSCAHNFNGDSLPVYKFLCDIQAQGLAQPNVWDWGVFREENHLPRVRYKNIILQKAKWSVTANEIKDWPQSVEKEAFQSAITTLRRQKRLPKLVSLIQGDNNLLIDLENHKAVSLLVDFIKKYKIIVLEEFLFTNENCVVVDKNGLPYTNEIIIPTIRNYVTPSISEIGLRVPSIQRKFAPSSEWLYIKLYGGDKTLEKLLMNVIYPFIENYMEKNYFEKFFFIRYRDPGKHLRLRFFNTDLHVQAQLQKKFMEIMIPHVNSGQIEKIVIDTYNREIERYSEELIIESETLFFNDSLSVLKLNRLLGQVEEGQKYRVIFAMRGIDALLNDFEMNLANKVELLKVMSSSFMQEFGNTARLRQIINDKYRKIQKEVFSNMDELQDEKNEIEEAIAIFKVRSENNKHLVEIVKEKLRSEEDNENLISLLRDYIHMQMNRLFITQQRKYELVIYSFLERYYSSQHAILQKTKR